ncbi:MAG: DUF4105 domain-containing protein [Clostridium sp.]|nr:DUF4105 domain-containing protein [Clostridium sp.]
MKRRISLIISLILLVCCGAFGQSLSRTSTTEVGAKADSGAAAEMAVPRVSFVNVGPGEDIYQLEGHSGLRLAWPGGPDIVVSYGTFDFDAPNFVYRFVKGETDYWCTQIPWSYFVGYYASQGRWVSEHPIELDSLQAIAAGSMALENLLPENRTYRYNYVKDNCALRPLRLLQAAIGDSIIMPEPSEEFAELDTYRKAMRRHHEAYPWYQFGIDLALGSGIDQPIGPWEKAFAPTILETQIDRATVGGKPLTSGAICIYPGDGSQPRPTPWWASPMAAAMLVLILAVAFTAQDIKRKRVNKWFDALFYGVNGLTGLVLVFLVFVSTHEATSPNWLLLWLNPLALIVPIFIWKNFQDNVVLSYQIANFASLICLIVALPLSGQSANAAFYPLILADAIRATNYIYAYFRDKNTKNRS